MAKKAIILSIELNADEVNKQLATILKKTTELKNENAALKVAYKEAFDKGNTVAVQQLGEDIAINEAKLRNLTDQSKRYKKEQDLVNQANRASKGSYEQLLRNYELAAIQLKNLEGTLKKNKDGTFILTQQYKDARVQVDQANQALLAFNKGIGDGRRNVGNYADSLGEVLKQTGLFSNELQFVSEGFQKVKDGVTIVKAGFGSLRAAIISTGIGALVVIFASLLTYFTKFKEGGEKLEQVFAGLGAIFDVLLNTLGTLGQTIIEALSKPKELLQAAVDYIKNTYIKAWVGIGQVIKGAFTLDIDTFNKGLDEIKGSAENAVQPFVKLREGIDDMQSAMVRAAKAAADLKQQEQDLQDEQKLSQVEFEKTSGKIEQLIKQAKERTLTEQQTLDALKEAGRLEADLTAKKLALANEELNITIQQNALKANLQGEDLKRFEELSKKKTELTKQEKQEFLDLVETKGTLTDEEFDKQLELAQKVVQIENESLNTRQIIANRESTFVKEIADEKLNAAKEYAQKKKELDAKLEDELLKLIEDSLQQQIATERLNETRRLNEIKGNSETERKLREAIKQTTLNNIAALEKKYNQDSINAAIDAERTRLQLLVDIAKEGSAQLFESKLELLDTELKAEIELSKQSATERKLSTEQLQQELILIEQKYIKIKSDLQDQFNQEAIQKAIEARQATLETELINLTAAGAVTTEVKIKLAEAERDAVLNQTDLTNEQRLLAEAQYQEKVRNIYKEGTEAQLQELEKRAEISGTILQGVNNLGIIFGQNQEQLDSYAKASALFQITIETGVALSKALSSAKGLTPFDFALQVAINTGLVLANIAKAKALLSNKEPKAPKLQEFDKGGYTIEKVTSDPAGYVNVPTMVVKDNKPAYVVGEKKPEWVAANWMLKNPVTGPIINKLERIRTIGVPMFEDGGYTVRTVERQLQEAQGTPITINDLVQAFEKLPHPIVGVEDIITKTNQVNVIETRAIL